MLHEKLYTLSSSFIINNDKLRLCYYVNVHSWMIDNSIVDSGWIKHC